MPVSDITPSVDDVAGPIRARTKTNAGKEAGTFLPAPEFPDAPGAIFTRPTAEQVTKLIQVDAATDIIAAFGTEIPDAPGDPVDKDRYRDAVKGLWALNAALLVELTYFPEQVATNRSPYPQLLERYNRTLARTQELVTEAGGGQGGDGGSNAVLPSGFPSGGGFPDTAIGMETPW